MNLAWREKRFAEMDPILDEHIVMKGPELKTLVRGRSELVQTFVDFISNSPVNAYEESDHAIDVNESTAVVTYDWSMTWEQAGKQDSGSGQDMFVFERRESQWVTVLRLMLF